MSMDDQVFRVSHELAGTDELHHRIRQIVAQYRLGHEADFVRYALNDPLPDMPDDLRHAINELIATYDASDIEPPRAIERIPLVGRLRQSFHQLVRYYVNRAAKRQVAFNTAAVHAIYLLLARDAQREAEIAALRARVMGPSQPSGDSNHD